MNVNLDIDDIFPDGGLTDSHREEFAIDDLETLAFLEWGHHYILEVLNGNPRNSRKLFRMEVDAFRALCSLLRSNRFLNDTRKGVTVEEQLGMFTLVVATGDEQRIVGHRFQHSTETIKSHVRKVMQALCRLGTHLIYPTHTFGVHPTIVGNSRNYPWFEGCIGAIDGTMIDAIVPVEVREACRNRHEMMTSNGWLFENWRNMELNPSGRACSDVAASARHPDMTVESARVMAAIRNDIAIRMWEARGGH
ncbi:hypothetical protein F2P56_031074 [Juglans regia]|uniref:DUF8040 domain-containing protein n=2 Tax=Juglans regia TaxID=51240 RepID=A0A833U341_JUGRE|nr:uncharacterized protein LOC108981842 [Juglans regia]KAF5450747.1 hypothetical protein F2P56_031074 [Juglans regia]